jgi:anthranilate synthase component 1
MISPTLEEVRRLVPGHTLIPIAMELYADFKTPVEILKTIQAANRPVYILESAPDGENWGRHTFLGYDPKMEISGKGDTVVIREGGAREVRTGDAHAELKAVIGRYKSPRISSLPPFTGGFVGYFAYEYFHNAEPGLKLTENDPVGYDDFRLMFFDRVIAFDHFRQKIILIVNIDVADAADVERGYIEGVTVLKDMERVIRAAAPPAEPVRTAVNFTASFTRNTFCAAAEKAKHHIREGDIFQCVPSIRFRSAWSGGLLEAYRVLRTTNPSAYMFYVRYADLELTGASPETLVSLKNGVVSTYPLAGTCARSSDEAETDILVEKLLHDEKELAEHDMLVDLGRNDIGKISRFGSVRVEEYRTVKKLSHVCHIASRVTGQIDKGYDALDVIAAVLPAGTLSGAPKKRACEIIDGLEGERRGAYGGAIGYIDFAGNMDLCIGIRMAALKDGYVYVQAGAGIVADSEPEREYAECVNKAGAMMEALKTAGKGVAL